MDLRRFFVFLVLLSLVSLTLNLYAGEADVIKAEAKKIGNSYKFDVTIQHKDTGWEHYADKFEILDEKGKVLGTRILYHPHVNE